MLYPDAPALAFQARLITTAEADERKRNSKGTTRQRVLVQQENLYFVIFWKGGLIPLSSTSSYIISPVNVKQKKCQAKSKKLISNYSLFIRFKGKVVGVLPQSMPAN
jgi:hypothetical protein